MKATIHGQIPPRDPEPRNMRKRGKAVEPQRNLAGETRPEFVRRRRQERAVLLWLKKGEDGRAYLWKLLVRLEGVGDSEPAAVRHAKSSNLGTQRLHAQLKSLVPYGSERPRLHRVRLLIRNLIVEIQRTAASDPDAPKKLRDYYCATNSDLDQIFGKSVGRRFWPDDSRLEEASTVRTIAAEFQFSAMRLARTNLPNYLDDSDKPRAAARALANFLAGRQNPFKKSPRDLQDLVRNLRKKGRLGPALKGLRLIARTKLSDDESKHAPITRLAKALEAQFRIWWRERFPPRKHFAMVAVNTAPPWLKESFPRKKELADRLQGHLKKLPGSEPKRSSSERYTRAGARRQPRQR